MIKKFLFLPILFLVSAVYGQGPRLNGNYYRLAASTFPATVFSAGGGGGGAPSCVENPPTVFLDQFNRADENPVAGGWANGGFFLANDQDGAKIISNQLAPNNSGGQAVWDTQISAGKQEVYVKAPVHPGSNKLQMFCKVSAKDGATGDGYELLIRDGTQQFYRIDNAADSTAIDTGWTVSLANDDIYHMVCDTDASGTLSFYRNGALVGTATDATYKDQAGYAGVAIVPSVNNDTRVDDFGARICQ